MSHRNSESADAVIIYAIVPRQAGRNEVYIGTCVEGNERRVYQTHMHGNFLHTREMMQAGYDERCLPDMYRLDRCPVCDGATTAKQKACIDFFTQAGYQVLMSEQNRRWFSNQWPGSEEFYYSLCKRGLADVLAPGNRCVHDYQPRAWK